MLRGGKRDQMMSNPVPVPGGAFQVSSHFSPGQCCRLTEIFGSVNRKKKRNLTEKPARKPTTLVLGQGLHVPSPPLLMLTEMSRRKYKQKEPKLSCC